ncbi:MAG: hypothetical protein JO235_26245 [Chroococcidiopsidaceae cyanobacterium CP_BM_RX_35]|nr:hypothetical protein [Chroococcidiopsidaceae cyanobacterium CP_BM_RX_35]
MNVNNLSKLLQAGFHISLGATGFLAQLLQEPQELADDLTRIQQRPDQLLQDLAVQGKNMERDAFNFLKTYFSPSNQRSQYPKYIESDDEQAFNQPYEIKGTKMYGFVLEASISKLQELCDKYLNEPANGTITYRPVTHYIILTLNDIDSLSSVESPGYNKGIISEQEAIFWVLTAAGKQQGPFFAVERLGWFMPFVYVNNSPILVSGREVYGFFKQLSELKIPKIDQEPDLFTIDALVFKKFSPTTNARDSRLLEIRRISQGDNHKSIKTWDSFEEIVTEIVRLLFDSNGNIDIPGLELPLNLLHYLFERDVPMVTLKQFRDVEDSRRACYQAIVEFLMQLQTYHRGKILGFDKFGDQFELIVNNFASQPIVQSLGLYPGLSPGGELAHVPIKLAFLLNFDFIVENGTIVWQASQRG